MTKGRFPGAASYTEGLTVEETLSNQKYDPRLLRRLLGLVLPYWPAVLTALVCLLVNSALQVASPLLTKIAIDKYLSPGGEATLPWLESRLPPDAQAGLVAIAWLYLGSIVGALVVEFSEQYLMQRTGQHAMFDLRRKLFAHLQRLDITYYDRNPVGRMVTRVTTDVDALNEMFASGIVTILGDVLVLAAIFFAMFRLSPELTLLLAAVLPLVLVVTFVFRRAVQSSNRQIRIAVARINSFLQEHVSGIAVLQLFNRESRAARDFAAVNRQHLEAYRGAIHAYGWFYPAVELLSMVALVALLLRGGFQVREGAASLGIVVAFFQYGMRIFRPIQDLSEKYNILQTALAAAERIFQLLDEPVKSPPPANTRASRPDRRPSSSTMSGSPTRTRTGCCAASVSGSNRARPRRRRTHGGRQDDADKSAAALLRHSARNHPSGRGRHSRA